MNKKVLGLLVSGVAMFALSGCGGGTDVVYVDPEPVNNNETTLFFFFLYGFSVANVEYTCVNSFGDVLGPFYTKANGEFTFEPGENCTFELIGFDGTPGDELFIESDIGQPKEGIPYSCLGGDSGLTDVYGSFDYLMDDSCTFAF